MGKSFKNKHFFAKIIGFLFIAAIIIGILAFIFAIYYFGILGLFEILNVEYDSLYHLFLFVLFYFLLSFVGDFISKIFKVLMSIIPQIENKPRKIILFLVNFFTTWAIIAFLNLVMDSITLSILAQLIFSVLIALIETAIEKKDKKKRHKTK